MATSTAMVGALKQLVRERGMTYRQLAEALELSESAVKRMFATGNMSLRRLDQICSAIACDLGDVLRKLESDHQRMDELPLEDEKALVDDPKLLLVAYCMVNHWTVETMVERYTVSQTDLIRCLTRLDRMRLIELLPENRVRTLVGSNFRWQRNGPIERFFRSQVQVEFFGSTFSNPLELHLVKMGDLSRAAQARIRQRLEAIGQLFDEIAEDERKVSSKERHGMTMVLAMREWRFEAFASFERDGG